SIDDVHLLEVARVRQVVEVGPGVTARVAPRPDVCHDMPLVAEIAQALIDEIDDPHAGVLIAPRHHHESIAAREALWHRDTRKHGRAASRAAGTGRAAVPLEDRARIAVVRGAAEHRDDSALDGVLRATRER